MPRMMLTSGTTILDVYAHFTELAGGGDPSIPVRSMEELRAVIPVPYRDCDRVSVSYEWAQGFDVPADVRVEP